MNADKPRERKKPEKVDKERKWIVMVEEGDGRGETGISFRG